MPPRGAPLLVLLLAGTGCASATLPRSGLHCPVDAIAKTADDGERGSREWCEIPSGRTDCTVYSGSCEVPGTSHGPWVRHYASGVRAEQADVVRGRVHGRSTKWFESGKLQMETEWRDSRREGFERRWYENGSLEWRGFHHANRREGTWTGWFANGQAAFAGDYRQNTPVGKWTFWAPGGATSRIEDFDAPSAQGGQNPALPNGLRVTRGFEDLPLRHESWLDGVRHGPFRTFDEHGVLREVEVYSAGTRIERWVRP